MRCAIELLTYNSRVVTGLEAPERGAPDARRFVVQLEALLALSAEARAWLLSTPGPSCIGGSTREALLIRRGAAIGPGSEAVSYADDPVHALRAEGVWICTTDARMLTYADVCRRVLTYADRCYL